MRHRWARDRVGQDGGYRERRRRDPFRHLADDGELDGELEMKFVMKERQAMDSGEFRMHDVTASEARDVCDRITAANKDREGKREL